MFIVFLISSFLSWQDGNWNIDSKGVAIEGYDPVSYFQGEPKEGDKENAFRYQGATFYFSSEKNLSTFRSNPEKYIPEYGGYCAYAMGDSGEKVEVDPETFKLIDGRLYLFYNSWINNTLVSWNKNETQLKQQADKNWEKIWSTDK